MPPMFKHATLPVDVRNPCRWGFSHTLLDSQIVDVHRCFVLRDETYSSKLVSYTQYWQRYSSLYTSFCSLTLFTAAANDTEACALLCALDI
eukprot:2345471-Pleurochrysis_carterae.AAC.3